MSEKKDASEELYTERAHLIAALSKIYPSCWIRDASNPEWPVCVIVIPQPMGASVQVSWHIAPKDTALFQHLSMRLDIEWDGHSTQEKYRRLDQLPVDQNRTDIPFNPYTQTPDVSFFDALTGGAPPSLVKSAQAYATYHRNNAPAKRYELPAIIKPHEFRAQRAEKRRAEEVDEIKMLIAEWNQAAELSGLDQIEMTVPLPSETALHRFATELQQAGWEISVNISRDKRSATITGKEAEPF